MKMTEKVALINQFLAADVTPFSSTESGRVLKTLQTSIGKARKHAWDQVYCATQLSTSYGSYKAHKASPGRSRRGRRPGSGISVFFARLEDSLDQMIGEFESEMEVEEDRNCRRQERAAKSFTNAKV